MKTSFLLLFLFLYSFSSAQTNKNISTLENKVKDYQKKVNNQSKPPDVNQFSMPPIEEKKSVIAAMLLSAIWPGGGQFYNGDYIKGSLMSLGQVACLVPLISALDAAKTEKYGDTNAFRAEIILALMVGNLIYSVIDAGTTARTLSSGVGLTIQLEKSNYLFNSLGENISKNLCTKILIKVRL